METLLCAKGTGQFGNQFMRNIALNHIAQKFDLKCGYQSNELMRELGIFLYSGSQENIIKEPVIYITDKSYMDVLGMKSINSTVNTRDGNSDYFQSKEITDITRQYLKDTKDSIIMCNPFRERYNNNNDIFIHVRLGDAQQFNPGLKYYLKGLSQIDSYDNIYVSTDSPNHALINNLKTHYPSMKIICYDEVKTFQFGSTCKYLILSHGSFSACIGYLAFYSTVFYSEYLSIKWHGDMFSQKDWNIIPLKSYVG